MSFETPLVTAGGTIRTGRLLKTSTAADFTVLEADANERIVGASPLAAKLTPLPGASANAAVATDSIEIFTIGTIVQLLVGSGGVTRGSLIKSDNDGQAVLAAASGATLQWIAGEALETAIEGDYAKVLLLSYPLYPALS